MTLGTVTATSPLTVRPDGSTLALPAKVAGGVTLTPAVNGRVLVDVVAGRLYVFGGA